MLVFVIGWDPDIPIPEGKVHYGYALLGLKYCVLYYALHRYLYNAIKLKPIIVTYFSLATAIYHAARATAQHVPVMPTPITAGYQFSAIVLLLEGSSTQLQDHMNRTAGIDVV